MINILSTQKQRQQFLDGEKLVDGMLRRVRVAAQQANRDPDEHLGNNTIKRIDVYDLCVCV